MGSLAAMCSWLGLVRIGFACVKHCARGFTASSPCARGFTAASRAITAAISHDEQALARDEDAIYH